MKKLLLMIAAGNLASQVVHAEPFKVYVTIEEEVNLDLIGDCKTTILALKACNLEAEYYTKILKVPSEYSGSSGTSLEVSKDFSDVDGAFQVEIAGTRYDLNGKSLQRFPFPVGTLGHVNVRILSRSAGENVMTKSAKASIQKVTLVLDGTAYIERMKENLNTQAEAVSLAKHDYDLQKDFLKYFKKSDAEIRTAKEILTGREADDFSYDCQRNGAGEESLLDPGECQMLRIFNDFLLDRDSGISIEEKDAAFDRLKTSTERLGQTVQVLKDAQAAYDRRYDKVLAEAMTALGIKP